MINWFRSLFQNSAPQVGDWLIFIDDVDTDFDHCTTSLKYNQVVKLLEIKKSDDLTIVDIGLRFKDSSLFSLNMRNGCNVPGQGIRWLKMSRFRVATEFEVDRWLSENDIEYNRDKKLSQILNK